MLEIIAIALVLLWLLGLVSSFTLGGFIHLLLVLAFVTIVVRFLSAATSPSPTPHRSLQPNEPNHHPLMNRSIFITILVVGIVLLIFGINAHDSVVSSAKETVTGAPADKSLWLIVLGIIGVIGGGLGSLFHWGGN